MRIFKPVLRLMTLLAAALAFAAAASAQAYAQAGSPRRVLVIYSYSRHLPWSTGVAQGLAEILEPIDSRDRPVLFEENIDADLAADTVSRLAWVEGIAEKYRDIPLDAVIAESQQAAALLLAHPGLFESAARFLFNYAPSSSLGKGNGLERGYSTASDLGKALEAIPLLLPSVRRVVVVADRSGIGLARTRQIRGIAEAALTVPLEIWDEFSLEELLGRARALPRDWAIFYLPVQRDREGAPLVAADVAARLSAAAPVPVFSHFDTLIGTGIVGGYSVSAVQLGRVLGRVAAYGDTAAPASQSDYAEATMGYWFDARALSRWRIPAGIVPPDSVTLFVSQTAWDRAWPIVLAALVIFAAESALVLGLARSSAQRKKAMAMLAAERASLEEKIALRTADLSRANAELAAEVAYRTLAEEREKASAAGKAMLFIELQHRIKNSMAIISSLVGIESDAVEAPEAKSSLATLGSRVSALASLYDILYDSGGIEDIDLVDYLGRVIDSAAESIGADARGISVTKHIMPASIDMKRAISIGLIVNELVTDCFKHAFPGGRRGTITVRLAREGEALALDIVDDGIGLPPGFNPAEAEGFGLKLVGLLAEQLGSSLSAASAGGSRFSLRFPA